tara:strand:- start:584 stop:1087 length:504 start_codon:yes stop_codon:yes gene_type:complete
MNDRKLNHCSKTFSHGGIDLSAGLMFHKVMYMKSKFLLLTLFFSITIYADNAVWFECGEVGKRDENKEFAGYPNTLGYIHDLPKTAIIHSTKISYLNIYRVAWETGVAVSNGKYVYVLMETPDGNKTPIFDREELTFANSQCKISDEETVIKKRDEMIEIQLGLNKI